MPSPIRATFRPNVAAKPAPVEPRGSKPEEALSLFSRIARSTGLARRHCRFRDRTATIRGDRSDNRCRFYRQPVRPSLAGSTNPPDTGRPREQLSLPPDTSAFRERSVVSDRRPPSQSPKAHKKDVRPGGFLFRSFRCRPLRARRLAQALKRFLAPENPPCSRVPVKYSQKFTCLGTIKTTRQRFFC